MELDVTLVAGRRPDLLATTLQSFRRHLFDHFEIKTAFVNIDPFCGTDADGDTCEQLVRDAFERVEVSRPHRASFGQAVKTLWAKPRTGTFLHLEDDWIMLEDLGADRIAPELDGKTVQVQLGVSEKRKSPHRHNYPARWRTILGLKIGKIYDLERPLFTTSPSFVRRDFAHACAALMNPDLDPEKQLYTGGTDLAVYTRAFRSLTLPARDGGALVRDLGRDWLAERNIRKEIVDGSSEWNAVRKQTGKDAG